MTEPKFSKGFLKMLQEDEMISRDTNYIINDENFKQVIFHLFYLATKHGEVGVPHDIYFDVDKKLVLIISSAFTFAIKNAQIDIQSVKDGYTIFNIDEKKWSKGNKPFDVYVDFLESTLSNVSFTGRTRFNANNIYANLDSISDVIERTAGAYVMAQGMVEQGEYMFKLERYDGKVFTELRGQKIPVHEESTIDEKYIVGGEWYLCKPIDSCGYVGLDAISKFGKVRSGYSPCYPIANEKLLSMNRIKDMDPAVMECSDVLEFFDDEVKEMVPMKFQAELIKHLALPFLLTSDYKFDLFFSNEPNIEVAGVPTRALMIKHKPTTLNDLFIEVFLSARTPNSTTLSKY